MKPSSVISPKPYSRRAQELVAELHGTTAEDEDLERRAQHLALSKGSRCKCIIESYVFRVWDLGFPFWGLGFRVWDAAFWGPIRI